MRFGMSHFVIGTLLGLSATQADAQPPAAIVEEVDSSTAGVEFMDYLTEGRTLRLSPNDKLVLGYLQSCWREVITGGTVTVGAEQSDVSQGTVERTRVRCEAQKRSLASKETTGSGAMVFRKKPELPLPDQTVYSLSPIFEVKGPGNLIIERLDKTQKPIEINVSASELPRGVFIDLANRNLVLVAGGLYRAKSQDAQIVIKIDSSADLKNPPIIGRLVRVLSPS